jgi:predicted ferric reductase
VNVSPGSAGVHLELAPVKRPIEFRPGQFGFLRIKEEGQREPHPFTIASGAGSEGHVQFVIRDLGDCTHRLVKSTTPGMYAETYAPFGRFLRSADAQREVQARMRENGVPERNLHFEYFEFR